MKGGRNRPRLGSALAAFLVTLIWGFQGLAGSFFVQDPTGILTATSRATVGFLAGPSVTPGCPGKASAARTQWYRACAAAVAFRRRSTRHSPEAIFGMCGVAPRGSGSGMDPGIHEELEEEISEDDQRRGRHHRREYRCDGLAGAEEVVVDKGRGQMGGKGQVGGQKERDRSSSAALPRLGGGASRGGANRGTAAGAEIDRGGFVRTVVGVLAVAPVMRYAATREGDFVAEAATVDRTRLGTPILTESVLLDLLPISGKGADVLRTVQNEIEKATILRTIYRRGNYSQPGGVVEQLTVPPSVWDRVQYVAESALEYLVDRRFDLEPVFRAMDSAETQIRRAQYSEQVFSTTREALMRMAAGAKERQTAAVLSAQEDALLGLGRIGELFDAGFPFEIDAGDTYDSIPRLLGRATVEVALRRDPDTPKEKPKALGNVTMVVDGYSSPVTAGNFIDLALRGFYDELPIQFNGVPAEAQVGTNNNETISTVVAGSYREGFVDPATGTLRRLPLEVLRVGRKGKNSPVYGAARNTKVFTKAPAVQTFRIPFAIAMNHPALDGNGASSEFFWLQDENVEKDGYLMDQKVEALDGRYAIFAYAVGNRKLLGRLKDGDIIERVTVTYGEDNLIRPKTASFADLLLKKSNGEQEE